MNRFPRDTGLVKLSSQFTQVHGRNRQYLAQLAQTCNPSEHTQPALLCTGECNKHQSSRGRCRANHSIFMTTVVTRHLWRNEFSIAFLSEWSVINTMQKHTNMFSQSFIKLVSNVCFEWKWTQTEGVSFLLFHAIASPCCNAQTAACTCIVLWFSGDTKYRELRGARLPWKTFELPRKPHLRNLGGALKYCLVWSV